MRTSIPIALMLLLAACSSQVDHRFTSGDRERGAAAISRYGCGSCHTISRIRSARGLVGPPLTHIKDRMYVAGMLPNTPENIEHWIRQPKSVNERTAMPDLGVTQKDASDIAAFLYSN
jgi:cytochrome c